MKVQAYSRYSIYIYFLNESTNHSILLFSSYPGKSYSSNCLERLNLYWNKTLCRWAYLWIFSLFLENRIMYCVTWNNFLFNYQRITSPDIHILYPDHPWKHGKNPYLGSTVLISFSNWSAASDYKNKNVTSVRIHKINDCYFIFFSMVKCLRTIWPTYKKLHYFRYTDDQQKYNASEIHHIKLSCVSS